MELKKSWKYHIILGIALLLLELLEDYTLGGAKQFYRNFEPRIIGLLITFYIASIIIYFVNYCIVCPKFLFKKNITAFIGMVFVLIMAFAGLRYLLQEVIHFEITGTHNYYKTSRNLVFYVIDNSYYAIKPIMYSTIIYLILKNNENKEKIYQLKLEQSQGEVSFLKSQISPHFLFNTLNTFYSELFDKQPDTAKDIHRLSELLRYVTYESTPDHTSLQKELKFIDDYIYFYKIRFENQLFVSVNVKGVVEEQQVLSLILIHFIENLFKHGVVNDEAHPASIDITIENDAIVMKTRNKTLLSEKYMGSGIGAQNVKRRLNAMFGTNYQLSYKTDNEYFESYLKMPL